MFMMICDFKVGVTAIRWEVTGHRTAQPQSCDMVDQSAI